MMLAPYQSKINSVINQTDNRSTFLDNAPVHWPAINYDVSVCMYIFKSVRIQQVLTYNLSSVSEKREMLTGAIESSHSPVRPE